MKLLIVFALTVFICTPAKADEIDRFMVKTLYSLVNADEDNEKQAVKYAQRAFMVTSGLEKDKKRLKKYQKEVLDDARGWAEDNLPESAETTVGAAFFAFKIITGTVKVPLGKDMSLRVGRREIYFDMEF